MQYKNKGPPKRSSGVLQTGICQTDYSHHSGVKAPNVTTLLFL